MFGKALVHRIAAAVLALGALSLGGTSASALVTYQFSVTGLDFFRFVDDGNGGFQQEYAATYNGSFTVQTTQPITVGDFYPQTACALDFVSGSDEFICGTSQEFRPEGFGSGLDFIGFQTQNADLSGGGGAFFFFADGAFTANGTYNVVDTTGFGFGNAGPGVLVVSGIEATATPEPASLAVLGLGLAGFAALRRHRA